MCRLTQRVVDVLYSPVCPATELMKVMRLFIRLWQYGNTQTHTHALTETHTHTHSQRHTRTHRDTHTHSQCVCVSVSACVSL